MTYHKFEIFLDVAESGSMSETGRRFFISPSSVSQTIASLEKFYNVTLFYRNGPRLCLTPAGLILSSYARRITALYREAEASLTQKSSRMIRVGCSNSLAPTFISPLVQRFQSDSQNAGVEITLTISHHNKLIQQILNYELDIAAISLSSFEEQPRLKIYPLFQDPVRLCCSCEHPFASRPQITFRDLCDQSITLPPSSSSLRIRFEQCSRKEGVILRNILTSNNTPTIKDMILRNQTISPLSAILVHPEVALGKIVLLNLEGFSFERRYALIHRNDKQLLPEQEAFIQACLASVPKAG